MKKWILLIALLLLAATDVAVGQERTVINNRRASRMILGRHFLSLQWISWEYYGRVRVRNRNGVFVVSGTQRSRKSDDFLKIEGVIKEVNRYDFRFAGKITTQVSFINGGKPCERDGEMVFSIYGKRRYWRLRQMRNPCDDVTDYVDIYFRK